MIKGIPITYHVKTANGEDAFNRPTYTETTETINNVLIAPASEQEVIDTLNMTGRKVVYILGIPKGDTHNWENAEVSFWGERFKAIGMPTTGIEAMIPLSWNTKVKVERYGKD